jgi:hypothetical protein
VLAALTRSVRMRPGSRRHLISLLVIVPALAVAGCTGGGTASSWNGTVPGVSGSTSQNPAAAGGAPRSGTPICAQKILISPYSYDGAPGTFTTSGANPGLPTFGSQGTNFPDAQKIIVVPAGDNSGAASAGDYQVTRMIVYFEPGVHELTNSMYTGNHSYYIGGYSKQAGKAVINGVNGGNGSFASKPSSGNSVYNTWEYLTIENFASTVNNAVLGNVNSNYGNGQDDGDVYRYDTIGPNEYGYNGGNAPRTGESNGGGYAINVGNDTTIAYNCLTQDAQGAFNGSSVVNVSIVHNEISRNGLGEYPDSEGPGGSQFGCGCSGGGKLFYSVNATVDYNYVHDNYNVGIWFDFLNSGADISYNYISSNWSAGIQYEASYNARIADNTLVGNSWPSDGPWPAGVKGGNCNTVTCTQGGGIIAGSYGNPQAAIYVANSGGNPSFGPIKVPNGVTVPGCASDCEVASRYSGHLWITGNQLINNFGGVSVYTDTNRYPGDIDHDASCATPLGALQETNDTLYYQQGTFLQDSNNDATISGDQVTTHSGLMALCDDYGKPPQSGPANDVDAVKAPVVGMAAFNLSTGDFLGTVTSVASAHSFTLSKSPGDTSGAGLLLSAYGGCGPADYVGGGPGIKSGKPAAYYWDNCMLGSRNVTVSHNTFSINANVVKGCTAANDCGFQQLIAFNAGVPTLMQFFDSYANLIGRSAQGLGNAWMDNTYTWTGPGQWSFEAGLQGTHVSQSQWRGAPYDQDANSAFS